MHKLNTKSLGVTPPVLRGFDASGLHRAEAEYDDRVPDGEISVTPLDVGLPPTEPHRAKMVDIILAKGFPKPLIGVLEQRTRKSGALPEYSMLTGVSSSPIPLFGEDPPVDDLDILGEEAPVERLAEIATDPM